MLFHGIEILCFFLNKFRKELCYMAYPGISPFLGKSVYNPAGSDPCHLGPRRNIKIFHDLVKKGHHLQNGRHEMQEFTFVSLLEGTGECSPGHPVKRYGMVVSFKWRFRPFIVADPFTDFLHSLLCLFSIKMHRDS